MARPLRLEFAGALYHVTARGNRREMIFRDDLDRQRFLDLLGREAAQQGWLIYAYCLMGNHYHLLVETPEANLGRGMRRLNGVYTQAFNRRHGLVGHVLQGRYKAILVDRDAYLRELCRYVVLNPVRAGLTDDAAHWPWSSYSATAGDTPCPAWLAGESVLALFGSDWDDARRRYRRFVAEGVGSSAPWESLAGQIFLGGEDFLMRMQEKASAQPAANVPAMQRLPVRLSVEVILETVAKAYGLSRERVLDRSSGLPFKVSVYLLRRRGNLPLREVAELAGVSAPRVSQIQAEMETAIAEGRLANILAPIK